MTNKIDHTKFKELLEKVEDYFINQEYGDGSTRPDYIRIWVTSEVYRGVLEQIGLPEYDGALQPGNEVVEIEDMVGRHREGGGFNVRGLINQSIEKVNNDLQRQGKLIDKNSSCD